MRRIAVQLLCIIFLTATAGCTQEEVVMPNKTKDCYPVPVTDYDNTYLLTRTWKLLWTEDLTTTTRTLPPCPPYREDDEYLVLKFYSESNICTGIGTINQFGGKYELSDTKGLSVYNIIQTLMGGTDEMAEFERKYFQALGQATSYEINHNFLTLTYGPFGRDVLFFIAIND